MNLLFTKVLQIIAACSISVLVMAQTPDFNWNKSVGGILRDQGDAVAVDPAGNIYVTGEYFSSSIDFGNGVTLNIGSVGSGNCDFFLTKYDKDGNAAWAVRGGGTLTDRGYGIVVDHENNLLVTGHYFGTATFDTVTRTSSGNLDMFVAKYDTLGKLQWFSEGKSVSQVSSRAITTDNAGNAYVVGYYGSTTAPTVNFGPLSLTSSGQREIFIVKYNPSGEPMWCTSAGGPKSGEEANDVEVDEEGNVYVTGTFVDTASFSGVTMNGKGSNEIFIAKYNPLGQLIWVRSAGGAKADEGNGIALDGLGNVYICGKIDSSATFESLQLVTAGGSDPFIAKYDTAGNFLWVICEGGTGTDNCYDIAVDELGDVIAGGAFSETATIGGNILTSTGNEDLFLMKVDALQNLVWIKQAGGPDLDRFGGLALDAGENIITTGYYSTWIKLGSDSLVSNGVQEIFVSKVGNNPIPVELTSFSAENLNNKIVLNWTTASETNNAGFEVERSINGKDFSKLVFIPGNGTTTEKHNYSFIDENISAVLYFYRLKQIDLNGTISFSNIVEVDASLPIEFSLNQNYPNPFNPATSISFNLPFDAQVQLAVYNAVGEHISDLVNSNYAAGRYKIQFDASNFASGMYLYRLSAAKNNGSVFSDTKKMIIIK
ncbi:MAG: SBBP repeat-containing protein [Ignavibacteriaceae bacterium]|nr:SBBP repeat-containing protein [Ignavibacteriaceae bacterium]